MIGEGAYLGPALRTAQAVAGREVAGVRLVLLAVAHVLVPQRQSAAPALAAPGSVEEPQRGGEVLQRAAQQRPGARRIGPVDRRQAAQRTSVGQTGGVGVPDQVRSRVRAQRGFVGGQAAGRRL